MRRTKKSLTKKIRFEVFKRDSFKCQYCGAAAPDVMLEVDQLEARYARNWTSFNKWLQSSVGA